MAVLNYLPQSGGLSNYNVFDWITTRNTSGNGTITGGALTLAKSSAKILYSMAETKFSDSAGSAAANGTVIIQGSNDNTTWVNVDTLTWSTATTATQKSGTATGYKYYRFQLNVTTTGSGWSKISASGFIAYR